MEDGRLVLKILIRPNPESAGEDRLKLMLQGLLAQEIQAGAASRCRGAESLRSGDRKQRPQAARGGKGANAWRRLRPEGGYFYERDGGQHGATGAAASHVSG